MPQAFLRRCLFLYLQFPGRDQLKLIIKSHLPEFWKKEEHRSLVDRIIAEFTKLQDKLKGDPSITYRVSTSNLLELVKAIDKDRDEDRKPADYNPEGFPNYYPILLKSYAALVSMEKIEDKRATP